VMTQLRLATKDFDEDNLPFRDARHLNITRENIHNLREFSKRMQQKLVAKSVILNVRKWADTRDDESESEASSDTVEAASASKKEEEAPCPTPEIDLLTTKTDSCLTVNQFIVHHLGASVEAWRPLFEFSEAAASRVCQSRRGFGDGRATGAGKNKRMRLRDSKAVRLHVVHSPGDPQVCERTRRHKHPVDRRD